MSPDARVAQRPVSGVNYDVCEADAGLVIEHGGQAILQSAHDFGGRIVRLAVSQNPRRQKALGEGDRERRTESLARAFGDQDSELAALKFEHVVEIAAYFMSRTATGGDGEIGKTGQSFGHQS